MTKILPGTEEQESIFKAFTKGTKHIMIKSVAGSGKTFTGVQCCLRDKDSEIAYVAFNTHIKKELENKIDQPNVECKTYHGLGYAALRKALRSVSVDEHKLDSILSKLINFKTDGYLYAQTRKLVSLAKQYGVWEQAELERLVDHHTLEIRGIENRIYDLVPVVLQQCKDQTSVIDYDDMVWLPKELGIKMPKYDIMLIDEAQDTNMAQQWLALESAYRLVVIGDPNQAIYGFRGSDVESMNRIREALAKTDRGVVDKSLSYTRRCPKAHVELAQKVVPEIKALDDAPDGIIKSLDFRKAVLEMKPGDLGLCRVNADLMSAAYTLIKNNIKAVVRGRDVGQGVEKLLDKAAKRAGSNNPASVLAEAHNMIDIEVDKYRAIPNGRGENRALNAQDKLECLMQISESAATVYEIKNRIQKLFADFEDDGKPKNAVVLGTVHRTKGLEANRVFVLRPELIPFPAAKKSWEVQQERNLAYVAVTRSMYNKENDGELVWCGTSPAMFCEKEKP